MRRSRNSVNWDAKNKLDRFFKAARHAGYIARQNFGCCGGCAAGEIATDFTKMPGNRRIRLQGAVYYNRQAAEQMWENNSVMLAFGQIIGDDGLNTNKSTVDTGLELVKLAEAEGLTVVWDGDENSCLEIYFEGAYRRWYPKQESIAA